VDGLSAIQSRIADIQIADPQLPQLGGRHSGGEKERHDCRVPKLLERRAVRRHTYRLQPGIVSRRQIDRRRLVLWPALIDEHLRGRIVRTQFDVDEVPREPVDQLEIAKAGGRGGRAILRKISEETVEVVRPIARHARMMCDQVVVEPREHRPVLNDRLVGKGAAVCAGGFFTLPLRVRVFGGSKPKIVRHLNRYTEI